MVSKTLLHKNRFSNICTFWNKGLDKTLQPEEITKQDLENVIKDIQRNNEIYYNEQQKNIENLTFYLDMNLIERNLCSKFLSDYNNEAKILKTQHESQFDRSLYQGNIENKNLYNIGELVNLHKSTMRRKLYHESDEKYSKYKERIKEHYEKNPYILSEHYKIDELDIIEISQDISNIELNTNNLGIKKYNIN